MASLFSSLTYFGHLFGTRKGGASLLSSPSPHLLFSVRSLLEEPPGTLHGEKGVHTLQGPFGLRGGWTVHRKKQPPALGRLAAQPPSARLCSLRAREILHFLLLLLLLVVGVGDPRPPAPWQRPAQVGPLEAPGAVPGDELPEARQGAEAREATGRDLAWEMERELLEIHEGQQQPQALIRDLLAEVPEVELPEGREGSDMLQALVGDDLRRTRGLREEQAEAPQASEGAERSEAPGGADRGDKEPGDVAGVLDKEVCQAGEGAEERQEVVAEVHVLEGQLPEQGEGLQPPQHRRPHVHREAAELV